MTDLITRLRDEATDMKNNGMLSLLDDAADEIARLTQRIAAAEARFDTAKDQADDYLEVAASRGHTIAKMIDERDSLTRRLAEVETERDEARKEATEYRRMWLTRHPEMD